MYYYSRHAAQKLFAVNAKLQKKKKVFRLALQWNSKISSTPYQINIATPTPGAMTYHITQSSPNSAPSVCLGVQGQQENGGGCEKRGGLLESAGLWGGSARSAEEPLWGIRTIIKDSTAAY